MIEIWKMIVIILLKNIDESIIILLSWRARFSLFIFHKFLFFQSKVQSDFLKLFLLPFM